MARPFALFAKAGLFSRQGQDVLWTLNLGLNVLLRETAHSFSMPTAPTFSMFQFGNQLRSPLTFLLSPAYHQR